MVRRGPKPHVVHEALLAALSTGPKSDSELVNVIRPLVMVGEAFREGKVYAKTHGITRDLTDQEIVERGYECHRDRVLHVMKEAGKVVRHSDGLWYLRDKEHFVHRHIDKRSIERKVIDELLYGEGPCTRERIQEVVCPLVDDMRALVVAQRLPPSYYKTRETRIKGGKKRLIQAALDSAMRGGMIDREGDKFWLTEKGMDRQEGHVKYRDVNKGRTRRR